LRANGNGCGRRKPVAQGFGGGHAKPVASAFNPPKPKRSPSVLDADAMDNARQRFKNTTKKMCVREEPVYVNNVEVIEVPKVRLNKQDEISSSEDSDVARTGSNSDHDNHQQQNEDDDRDSESVSSSDDSSGDSGDSSSDSRTISAGDDRAAAPAKAAIAPRDDEDPPKPDLLQSFREKDHRDDVAVSCGSWARPPLNDEKQVAVQEQVHRLEQEAYTALTRAFHASSDALSWEKADLLADLRKHLHISNDEHLQVINAVSNRKGRRFGRPGNG
jgi:hypothetical protein